MARNTNNLSRPSGEECEYMKPERARLKAAAQGHFANRKGDTLRGDAGLGRGPAQEPARGKSRPTPKAAFTGEDRGRTGGRF